MEPLPSGYRIEGTGRRDFRVVDPRGTTLGDVRFQSWMNNNAVGGIPGHTVRFIVPGLFQGTPHRIEVDGQAVGTIRFTWPGQCRIQLELGGRPWPLRMGPTGFFRHGLCLRTDQDVPLVDLRARWKWFAPPDYDLLFPGGSALSPEALPLVLVVTGYTAALIRARRAAAGAAT